MIRRGICVLVALTMLGACSGGGTDAPSAALDDMTTTTTTGELSTATTAPGAPSTALPPPSSGRNGAANPGSAVSTTTLPPASTTTLPPATADLPFTVKLTPECAHPADSVVTEIRTTPGVYLAASATFADGSNYEQRYMGPVNPDGTLSWTWLVPASAPEGDGIVAIAAWEPKSNRKAERHVPFRVAAPTKC